VLCILPAAWLSQALLATLAADQPLLMDLLSASDSECVQTAFKVSVSSVQGQRCKAIEGVTVVVVVCSAQVG
jgi:hypothetical protein